MAHSLNDPDHLLAQTERVRRFVRGLIAEDRVEDVVQETMLALVTSPPSPRASTGAWLSGVARNVVRKVYRSEARRRTREAAAARPEGSPSSEEVVLRLEEQRRALRCVRDLAEPFRTALFLRYFEDLPPRKIAQRQGVSVETVKSRLKRGLERVRRQLDREHGGSRKAWRMVLLPVAFRGLAHRTARAAAVVGVALTAVLMLTAVVLVSLDIAAGNGPSRPPVLVSGASEQEATAPISPSGTEAPGSTSPGERGGDETLLPTGNAEAAADDPGGERPAVRPDPRIPPASRPGVRQMGQGRGPGIGGPTGLWERFAPLPPEGRASLEVSVKDRDGLPVAGADVYLGTPKAAGERHVPFGSLRRIGRTDDRGVLRAERLPEGAASVAANLDHLLNIDGRRALDARTAVGVRLASGETSRAEVSLPFALAEMGSIRGRIVGPGGESVRLVQVFVGHHDAKPDAAGRFEMAHVPVGRQRMKVLGTGYRTYEKEVEVVAGRAVDSLVRLDYAERGSRKLEGTVVGPDGEPVPGAGIMLSTRRGRGAYTIRTVRTDDRGQFRIESLPVRLGSCEVQVHATRRGYRSGTLVLPEGIGAGQVEVRLPVRLVELRLVVLDSATSEPLTRCRFEARVPGADRSRVTFTSRSTDGRYETWLAPGRNELTIEAPDHEALRVTVDVGAAGGTHEYIARLVSTGEAGPETVLSVSVSSDLDGEPVEHARVEILSPRDGRTIVAIEGRREAGRFVLPVAAGTWKLRVRAEGFESHEQTIRLTSKSPDREVRIILHRE